MALISKDTPGMKQYRKKPVVIHAKQMTEPFEVMTLEGLMRGSTGDYLVIGVKGEAYPVREDIFLETYEEADDDQS